jgi:quinol monooxygenase YgiN
MHTGVRQASATPTSARLGWILALALAALHLARGVGGAVRAPIHRRKNTEPAFVLHVELVFSSAAKADELVKAWARCADWCRTNEAGLLHYEISQSNSDPLKYGIFERYASLNAYAKTHKSTEAYRTFRPTMQAMQDSGELKVSGSSYFELGHGFVSGS